MRKVFRSGELRPNRNQLYPATADDAGDHSEDEVEDDDGDAQGENGDVIVDAEDDEGDSINDYDGDDRCCWRP